MDHTQPLVQDLMQFLDASPVNFLAVEEITRRLDKEGFTRLHKSQTWNVKPGGRYYLTQNDSAVMAFVAGTTPQAGYHIIAAHSDSPGFRIKPHPEMKCENGVVKLNTEVYGGPILYTWFDRPLSIAGRVIVRSNDPLHPHHKMIRIHRPLLTIPHLAIHFNRAVNEGNPLSKQKDMLPVIAVVNNELEANNMLLRLISEETGVAMDQIIDFDLSLYDTTPAALLGLHNEFITSGRLDDLSMVHAALCALTSTAHTPTQATRVMAIFDNEETGSGTKQGAASPLLKDTLMRINRCLGGTDESYFIGVANSFMVSADNAHALHPNYVEKQDPTNHPGLGLGPVIKINANCKYMSDADSAAVFAEICRMDNLPVQYFVNHSDVAGGSTLGNILTSQIDLRGVDMGAAIWAMHSVRETASAQDHLYITRAFTQFLSL